MPWPPPPPLPQELVNRPWAADYQPPAPPDENSNVKKTPEEIEREIKAQEAELQKLLQVNMLASMA